MEIWKKVDVTKWPFNFSPDESELEDTGKKWLTVYNLMIELELGGKNLEYLWSEEEGDEPAYLDEFECEGWYPWMTLDAESNQLKRVGAHKGSPIKGIGWVINFEMLSPIWIREIKNG